MPIAMPKPRAAAAVAVKAATDAAVEEEPLLAAMLLGRRFVLAVIKVKVK